MSDCYFTGHHTLSKEFPEHVAYALYKTLTSRAIKAIERSRNSGFLATMSGMQDKPAEGDAASHIAGLVASLREYRAVHFEDSESKDEIDMYAALNEEAADK